MGKNLPKNYLKIFEMVLIGSFVLAGLFLYWQEKLNHNPNYQKNWVNFYFKNPADPTDGVELNNYLGYEEVFNLCLIPDSNDLMEPKDLSCNLETAMNEQKINLAATKNYAWQWEEPTQPGKYWVVLQYITKDGQENKRSLSFEK